MAWQMLNCRYLRLTENNVKMLEHVCGEAGYDVSAHPHTAKIVDAELLVIVSLELFDSKSLVNLAV